MSSVFTLEFSTGQVQYYCRNRGSLLTSSPSSSSYRICEGGGYSSSVFIFPEDGQPQHWVMKDSNDKWMYIQMCETSGCSGISETQPWMNMNPTSPSILKTHVYTSHELQQKIPSFPVSIIATLLSQNHFYTAAISLLPLSYQKSLYLYMSGSWSDSLSSSSLSSDILSSDLKSILSRLLTQTETPYKPILSSPHCLHFPLLCTIINSRGGSELLTKPINDIGLPDYSRLHYSKIIGKAIEGGDEETEICGLLNNALNYKLTFHNLLEISKTRDQLLKDLGLLKSKSLGNYKCLPVLSLALCYHGLNDKSLIAEISSTIKSTFSVLDDIPPTTTTTTTKRDYKRNYVKIGIISSHLKTSSVCKALCPTLKRLATSDVWVTGIVSGKYDEHVVSSFNSSIILTGDFENDVEVILEEEFDVVLYTDVNMSPYTYLLSFTRLAPVQCTFWGHHGTSGNSVIDYYLLGSKLELGLEIGSSKYVEQIVKFGSGVGVYLDPTDFMIDVEEDDEVDDFLNQLPRDSNLYIIPQTSLKLHPKFDSFLKSLLSKDPKAIIICLADIGRSIYVSNFRSRLNSERILFLPNMNRKRLAYLEKRVGVALDTFPIGGGITTFEMLMNGVCVVGYSEMSVIQTTNSVVESEFVAEGVEEYADMAINVRRRVDGGERCEGVWEGEEVVEEYREFFRRVGGG